MSCHGHLYFTSVLYQAGLLTHTCKFDSNQAFSQRAPALPPQSATPTYKHTDTKTIIILYLYIFQIKCSQDVNNELWFTTNTMQLNMTHTCTGVLWVKCIMEGASCILWGFTFSWRWWSFGMWHHTVYQNSTNVSKNPLAYIMAHESSRLLYHGLSLPNYIALQPKQQWSSLFFLNLKSLRWHA
jgi:hypothetical protein